MPCTFSIRRCPGILSYHISHHAVQKVLSGSMDGLWRKEPEEANDEGKEVLEEAEGVTEQETPVLKCEYLHQLNSLGHISP